MKNTINNIYANHEVNKERVMRSSSQKSCRSITDEEHKVHCGAHSTKQILIFSHLREQI